VALASILNVERKDRVLRALGLRSTPDQINKILAIRNIYRGERLGIGWETSFRSKVGELTQTYKH
jgi:hypothetical protein